QVGTPLFRVQDLTAGLKIVHRWTLGWMVSPPPPPLGAPLLADSPRAGKWPGPASKPATPDKLPHHSDVTGLKRQAVRQLRPALEVRHPNRGKPLRISGRMATAGHDIRVLPVIQVPHRALHDTATPCPPFVGFQHLVPASVRLITQRTH